MAAWRYEISLLMLKIFQHLKRNFVSPRSHVISSIYLTIILQVRVGYELALIISYPTSVIVLLKTPTKIENSS